MYLYIFYLGYESLYKVGFTRNWERRIHEFEAANPWITPDFVFNVPNEHVEGLVQSALIENGLHYNREIFKMQPQEVENTVNYICELGGVEA